MRLGATIIVVVCFRVSSPAQGQYSDSLRSSESWSLHFQQTIVTQSHPGFHAAYSGRNSLKPSGEAATSVTATLFFGVRLWTGAGLYVNPELSGGRGVSNVLGIAGYPNGEIYRIGDPTPTVTPARIYLSQVIRLGAANQSVEDEMNQISAEVPIERITLVAGKFSLTDFFDDNTWSHDPRSQFLNWAIMDDGAWDYAADTRGYTWGVMAEYNKESWAFRCCAVMVPSEANGLAMDTHIDKANSLNVEFEHRYRLGEKAGIVRLMAYRNRARMGEYRQTIDDPRYDSDITLTREYGRTKYGAGLSFEQQLLDDLGAFMRLGWNDGKTETWAFTEIDRTCSLGALLAGKRWNRPDDHCGLAVAVNGISGDHADYLARGGYGFLIGDGALRYTPEITVESFYSARLATWIYCTGDYQMVIDPAYNRDRGPVHLFSCRIHVEM